MDTNKKRTTVVGAKESEMLRLLVPEVDENGSATLSTVTPLFAHIRRWPVVLANLARKDLLVVDEERDRVQFTPAGFALAEEGLRIIARLTEVEQTLDGIRRFAATIREAVDAENAVAAECAARALPAHRGRFAIQDGDQLAVNAGHDDGALDWQPLLSANDAIRADARGAAAQAAARALGFEARPRKDVPEYGQWHDLLDEEKRLQIVRATIDERVRRARRIQEDLAKTISNDLLVYALQNHARDAVIEKQHAAAFVPVLDAIAAAPQNLATTVHALREVQDVAALDLRRAPWHHNSTDALENVLNLWRADALAAILDTAERLLGICGCH